MSLMMRIAALQVTTTMMMTVMMMLRISNAALI